MHPYLFSFYIHYSWIDFYSGGYKTSDGGAISGNISVSGCIFQNLESHAINCTKEKSFVLIESSLFHHISSNSKMGGSFLMNFPYGNTVLNKICIYKSASTNSGNAFYITNSATQSYLISITKCDEKTSVIGTIASYNGMPTYSNTNVSYCSSLHSGYDFRTPQKIDILKFGNFIENESPSQLEFYYNTGNVKVTLCNYVQNNNQGSIMTYSGSYSSLTVSDSVFILNPDHNTVSVTSLINCNINGIIYNDQTNIGSNDVTYNEIPNRCYNHFKIDQQKKPSCACRKKFSPNSLLTIIFS